MESPRGTFLSLGTLLHILYCICLSFMEGQVRDTSPELLGRGGEEEEHINRGEEIKKNMSKKRKSKLYK